MSTILNFNPTPHLSTSLLTSPLGQTFTTHHPHINFSSNSYLSLLPHKILIQKPIICARSSKRASGYSKLWKIFPKVLTFMASECKIFPEPVNVVIRELGDGCFDGLSPRKGLKGLNFDGLRRKRKRKSRSLLGWVMFGMWCFLLCFFRGLNNEVFLWMWVFGLFGVGVLLSRGIKRVFKGWILGVLFVVGLVGVGFKRGDLKNWVEMIRVYSPVVEIVKRKRK